MNRFRPDCSFGEAITCEDGVPTNFHFAAYNDAKYAWAFPDLTAQAEYLGDVIRETVETEMRQEAEFLLDLRNTRERVKEVYEFPDVEVDRIIRSVRQNQGSISGKLSKEFPVLSDPAIGDAVVAAVLGSST